MRDGGKGDKPRPIPDRKKFEDNWDAIFNKNQKKITENGLFFMTENTEPLVWTTEQKNDSWD
jgi:hypothetical protein